LALNHYILYLLLVAVIKIRIMDLNRNKFIAKKSISIDDKEFIIVEGEDITLLRTHIKNDKLYVVLKNVADNEVEILYDIFCVLFEEGDYSVNGN